MVVLANMSCANCYFYDQCEYAKYRCSYFSPIEEVEWTEWKEEKYIEDERKEFHRRFWNTYKEEDRLQDLFG